MALQWTEEENTLNNIKRAVASGWRMNSRQLSEYSRRLQKVQQRALPGELGSAFVDAVSQFADGNADISWQGLLKDTEKILRILQNSRQWEKSDWIARLPFLEERISQAGQKPYFQTVLGAAFLQVLKRKLGAGFRVQEKRKPGADCYGQGERKPGAAPAGYEADMKELEQLAAWLMDSASAPAAAKAGQKKRAGFLAKLPPGTLAAMSACVSVCLLSAWLYGQAERNQSFYHIQRLKATALSQQADTPQQAEIKPSGKQPAPNQQSGGQVVKQQSGGQPGAAQPVGSQEKKPSRAKRPKILMQYRNMAKEYPGLFGWLKIPDTQIDLPVMQPFKEKEFYLSHDFTGAPSAEGALFADPQNSRWPQDGNTVIYGHNMKNGHLFGTLDLYEDPDYLQAHKKIYFDTIYETGVYEAVAVLKTRILNEDEQGFRYYRFFQYDSRKDFQECLDFVKENQLFDTGSTLKYKDRILMLSTCEYSQENGRLVIVARKTG